MAQTKPATWVAVAAAVFVIAIYFVARGGSESGANMVVARIRDSATGGDSLRGVVMLERFRRAEEHVNRMRSIGEHELFTFVNCPDKFSIGMRPPNQKAPNYAGNTCEPWMARFAINMLDQLLDTGMRALEWGSGSSTAWTLMRVGHLTSIEHDSGWAPRVTEGLTRIYGSEFLEQHWQSHVAPRGNPTKPGVEAYKDPDSFTDYSAAKFLPNEKGVYDYIAVDGRSRVACVKRALALIKPEGGILLLDNSDRKWYEEAFEMIPTHWPRYDDLMASTERTTLWVTCRKGACG